MDNFIKETLESNSTYPAFILHADNRVISNTVYGYDQLRKYGKRRAMEAVWKLSHTLEKSELQAGYK